MRKRKGEVMAKIEICRNCVYAYWDAGLWMRTLWSGFPAGPMCANCPGALGVMREVRGGICRNYRPSPPEPGAQAKRITLTNGMVAYVDACDYEEISRYSWHLASGGYAGRRENRKLILMHRQIMNPPEGMVVDHIKGNRLDNTRARLRVCTPWENARNRVKNAGSASRHIGVSLNRGRKKWVAKIPLNGKYKHIGRFEDELEAARAHDYAAVLYLGDSARLNFPDEWPSERRAEVAKREGKKAVGSRQKGVVRGQKAKNTRPRAENPQGARTKKSMKDR
jgi:hypothetical protein